MPAETTVGVTRIELVLGDKDFKKGMLRAGNDFNKFAGKLGGLATVASQAITTAFKVSATALVAFGAASVKVGSDFEHAMATLASISGEQIGSEGFKQLEKQARLLGSTTLFTATQAAEALTELSKAGLEVDEAITASNDTMFFAGATGMSLANAANLVAAAMAQFGLKAHDSARITDVYSKAIRTSLLDTWSLTEAMKFAGTAGSAFGNTIEETTTVVAAFRDMGLEGSLAGTNFRMMLQFAAKASGEAEEALKRHGMTLEDINPETHTAVQILNNLADSTLSAKDALTIFGARSGAAVLAITNSIRAGDKDLNKYLESLKNAGGETEAMYKTILQSLRSEFTIAKSVLVDSMIELFQLIGPHLTSIVQGAQILFRQVTTEATMRGAELRVQLATFFGHIQSFMGSTGPGFVTMLFDMAQGFLFVANELFRAAEFIVRVTKSIAIFIPSMWGLVLAIKAITVALDAFNSSAHKSVRNNVENTKEGLTQLNDVYNKTANEIADLKSKIEKQEDGSALAKVSKRQLDAWKKQVAALEAANKTTKTRSHILGIALVKQEQAANLEAHLADQRKKRNAEYLKQAQEQIAALEKLGKKGKDIAEELKKAWEEFWKLADSIIEEWDKTERTPLDQISKDAEDTRAKLQASYNTVIALAKKQGVDTTALEQKYADAKVAISKLEHKRKMEFIKEETQRHKDELEKRRQHEVDFALDVRDIRLDGDKAWLKAHKANLSKEAQIEAQHLIRLEALRVEFARRKEAIDSDETLSAEEKTQKLAELSRWFANEAVALGNKRSEEQQDADDEAAGNAEENWERQIALLKKWASFATAAVGAVKNAFNQLYGAIQQVTGLSMGLSDIFALAGEAEAVIPEGANTVTATSTAKSARESAAASAKEAINSGIAFAEGIADNIDIVIESVISKLPKLMTAAADALGVALLELAKNADDIIDAIIDGILAVAEAIAENIGHILIKLSSKMGDLVTAVISAAGDILVAIIDALPGIVTNIVSALPGVITTLASSIGDLIAALLKALPDILIAIFDALPDILNALMDAVPTIIDGFIEGLFGEDGLVSRLPDLIMSFIDSLVEMLPMIIEFLVFGFVLRLVPTLIKRLPDIVISLVRFIVVFVFKVLPNIAVKLIEGVIAAIGGLLSQIWKAISSLFGEGGKEMLNKFWEALQSLGDKIKEFFKKITWGAISSLYDKFKEWLQKLWDSLKFWKKKDDKDDTGAATGIRVVPRTMSVKLHPGEAVLPQDQNPYNPGVKSGGSGGTSGMGGWGANKGSGEFTIPVGVSVDGRVIDGSIIRAGGRGKAPGIRKMIRKASGTKVGFSRRGFSNKG